MKPLQITYFAATTLALMSSSKADVVSSFDIGPDGWTATGGILSYVGAGGNPSGFLSLADQLTHMTLYAPAGYLGDLSAYLDGTLSFDTRNLNGESPNLLIDIFGTVTISGPGGVASKVLGGAGNPPADDLWHSYSAPLSPGVWSGSPLAAVLAHVNQIKIDLESAHDTVEINGFDNFSISTVPEPSTALMGAVVMVGLVLRRTRSVRSA